jgi:secreted PhoX family phosphatase
MLGRMDLQATTATAGTTRRSFIRGVAQAGASTIATASVLQATGVVDLLADAEAYRGGGGHSPFSEFEAIAASGADAVEVPAGFRADVLISYGDEFARPDGTQFTSHSSATRSATPSCTSSAARTGAGPSSPPSTTAASRATRRRSPSRARSPAGPAW